MLGLGLRYEMSTVPTEVRGKLATLRTPVDAQPHLGDPYFVNPTLLNFEPRVGFAWSPGQRGKAVVRGGFGIFDVLPLPYEFELISMFNAPFFQMATPTNLPQGSFPRGGILIAEQNSNTFREAYIEPHPARNYVMQWNLTIEGKPAKGLSGSIGYVGSRGIHQPFRIDDMNAVLPSGVTDGLYSWPMPVGSGQKINPNVGRLDGLMWRGDSYYHGLQLQVRAAVRSGLQVDGAYTFGKSTDTGSATIAGDQFANSVSSLPWFDSRLNRGPSDFNITQSGSVHFSWELPLSTSAGLARWALQGWQLRGAFQAGSGAPFTPVIGGDPLGLKSTDPIDVPDLLHIPGCKNPVNAGSPTNYLKIECFKFPNPGTRRGNLGRNSLTGPGLTNLNLSLQKNTYIQVGSGRLNAQLRGELFNALNHTNLNPPLDHRTIFDAQGNLISGAGLINTTATPSRQVQIGLKLIW